MLKQLELKPQYHQLSIDHSNAQIKFLSTAFDIKNQIFYILWEICLKSHQ